MQPQKLTKKDIELLRRQGLAADIRNKLCSWANILYIIDTLSQPDDGSEIQKKAKAHARKTLKKTAKENQKSLDHIVASLNYVTEQPKHEHSALLLGVRKHP